jgi:hypothetical protein
MERTHKHDHAEVGDRDDVAYADKKLNRESDMSVLSTTELFVCLGNSS